LARFEQMNQEGFMWAARVVAHLFSEAPLDVCQARVRISQNGVDNVAGLSHNWRLQNLRLWNAGCFHWRMHSPVEQSHGPGSRQKSVRIQGLVK
jgi:hypothetical protein